MTREAADLARSARWDAGSPPQAFFARKMKALTVRERGCSLLRNGELLEAAQHEFEVLLTAERSIHNQQNLSRLDLSIVVLQATSNTSDDLKPLMEKASGL